MIDSLSLSLFIDRRLLLSDSGLVESRGGGKMTVVICLVCLGLCLLLLFLPLAGSVIVYCVLLSGVHVEDGNQANR